jgi:hypothetical protein
MNVTLHYALEFSAGAIVVRGRSLLAKFNQFATGIARKSRRALRAPGVERLH